MVQLMLLYCLLMVEDGQGNSDNSTHRAENLLRLFAQIRRSREDGVTVQFACDGNFAMLSGRKKQSDQDKHCLYDASEYVRQ